ncbi:MAG: hypothetical protein EB144_04460, partial [Actinobacteria bacterium]|nr:hypothetical protein [Actinomycetota bacterium]
MYFWPIIKPRRYQCDLSEYKRAVRSSVELPDYLLIGNRLGSSNWFDTALFDLASNAHGRHA